MIQVSDISKKYGAVQALHDISFAVPRGELFGLIGPDGAGKTTLMRLLVTLLLPDTGRMTFDGRDVVRDYRYVRRNVGYMPGLFSLYRDLSVRENLDFFASVFNTTVEENYDLIKDIYVMLEPFAQRRSGALSGGMKQKLALCCALIHKPLVLILDEPTTGVDVVSRREFWAMLRKLKAEGITIIVSTPYMDEAALCDRVGLIQGGRLMQVGTPQEVIAAFDRPLYAATGADPYTLLHALRAIDGVERVYPFGTALHVTSNQALDTAAIAASLQAQGLHGVALKPIDPNIEDLFMHLMR
ncbi:MAG: ABC transporter ATP-binding protein [Flavobacteriales bacterium]|nr:MAG: ABC transporter ATP-binding protein [Flavobacteriales bacterium]